MMCVCITVTTEIQEVRVSAPEGEEATECQPEPTATQEEPEHSDVATGGYRSKFQESGLPHG
jgi:hypothetical protein